MEASSQSRSPNAPPNDVRIGTAGWSYKDWDGIFYPPGMQRRKQHPLEYLARFFDTTEINTSFYGPLKPELAKLWCRKVAAVNKNFLFTAKLYRAFTHSPIAVMEPTSAATIRPTDEDEARTREGLDAIASEGRLGALLIQFPVSFKNTSLNREYLDRLLRQFIEYPRVVEVRDSSWNDAETLAAFAQKNVGFCNIDQPVLGRSLAPTEHVTGAIGYVRLHGRNYEQVPVRTSDNRNDRYNYLYNERELAGWKAENRKRRRARANHLRHHQQSLRKQSRRERAGVESDDQRQARARPAHADRKISGTGKDCRPGGRFERKFRIAVVPTGLSRSAPQSLRQFSAHSAFQSF